MRSLQGLLFFVVAVFAVKWQYAPSQFWRNVDVGHSHRHVVWETVPPLDLWMEMTQAGALVVVGMYLIGTGEWAKWTGRDSNYSIETFNALVAWFASIFCLKFAYNTEVGDWHPPFNKGLDLLGVVCPFLMILFVYFFICGEFAYWKCQRAE